MQGKRQTVLRLQVPFCFRQCAFCSKTILPGWDPQRLHAYVQALIQELKANGPDFADCQVQAVRIGGGNVTALTGEDLWELYLAVRDNYDLAENAPVTLLASPFQINGSLLAFLNRIPVRRYDYEIFSCLAEDDGWLDRPDPMEKLRLAGVMTHAAETGAMGAVMVLGHPAQTEKSLHKTLVALTRTAASHLTFWQYPGAAAELPAEDRQLLENAGFGEYVPGCFALAGQEDRYHRLRQQGSEVLAFGMGAETVFDGAVSRNTMDLAAYLAHSDDYRQITVSAAPLS